MATGITLAGTSNLSQGQRIMVAAARLAFEPAAPNADLIDVRRIPTGHKQWDIETYARLSSASALTEGVDVSQSEQLVTNYISITPSEHGIICTLSKRLIRRQGDVNVVTTAGRQIAESLRRRLDLDIITLFDGFSKSTPGSGTPLDVTHFRGIAAYLMTDNDANYGPAQPPFVASMHIEQISDIILDVSDPGTAAGNRPSGWGEEMLQRWWRGRDRLYGVEIFHGGNISRDTSGDSKGAIMNREALCAVMANEADPTEEDDKSLRAIEYGIFQEWGEAERADPHGVEVYSDTAATV